jgi:hypothetical protein
MGSRSGAAVTSARHIDGIDDNGPDSDGPTSLAVCSRARADGAAFVVCVLGISRGFAMQDVVGRP